MVLVSVLDACGPCLALAKSMPVLGIGGGALVKPSIMDSKGVDMRLVYSHNTVLLRVASRGCFVLAVLRGAKLWRGARVAKGGGL